MRRPERERERLVSERVALENRIANLLCLHGVAGFKPRLRGAGERLGALRDHAGDPLPPKLLEELRRLMARHRLLSEQLREIETAREQAVAAAEPDCTVQQIRMLARLFGLGLATATTLVHEVFCRPFANRKALAGFVGLTGTPFNSGGTEREQGISKSGNPRVRRLLIQLVWRWLRFQPDSALSRWFAERTAGARGRIRKIMAVALARKLLVGLWRYLETGELPAGARLVAG
jgi:transposase